MAILGDFVVIQGDVVRKIGDGAPLWERNFNTKGRRYYGHAILTLMVKGLTVATSDVDVKINNRKVGVIHRYSGAHQQHWFTQIINIQGRYLSRRTNEIQIAAAPWPGARAGDLYDDFFIKDVVCFFQQSNALSF